MQENIRYSIDGIRLDSVDLKALVVTRGVKVSSQVYKKFGPSARLSKNPSSATACFFPMGP